MCETYATLTDQGSRGSLRGLQRGLAHNLLEDARQDGVYSKLSRTDLVGLLGKLDSVVELELFCYNRLGLDTCPYPLSYIKRGMVHLLVHTIIQTNPTQKATCRTGVRYYTHCGLNQYKSSSLCVHCRVPRTSKPTNYHLG
jgi:hypothetical protein